MELKLWSPLLLPPPWPSDAGSQPSWSSPPPRCLTVTVLLSSPSHHLFLPSNHFLKLHFLITLYVRNYAKWSSDRVDLAVSGDIFWLSQPGEGEQVETRDTAEYPVMQDSSPIKKNDLAQHVSRVEIEKLELC